MLAICRGDWKGLLSLWGLNRKELGPHDAANVREVSKHWIFYETLDILLSALPAARLEYRLQKGASVM